MEQDCAFATIAVVTCFEFPRSALTYKATFVQNCMQVLYHFHIIYFLYERIKCVMVNFYS